MYVVNLAAADLLMCVGNFPVLVVSTFHGRWVTGYVGCKIYSFLGGLSGFVSINTLTAMACDRYNAIYRHKGLHLRRSGSRKHSLGFFFSLWVYSFFWSLPPFFGWGQFSLDGGQISCCFDYLDRSLNNVVYIVAMFVFCFGIQVLVVLFCYGSIVRVVCRHEHSLRKNIKIPLYRNHYHHHSEPGFHHHPHTDPPSPSASHPPTPTPTLQHHHHNPNIITPTPSPTSFPNATPTPTALNLHRRYHQHHPNKTISTTPSPIPSPTHQQQDLVVSDGEGHKPETSNRLEDWRAKKTKRKGRRRRRRRRVEVLVTRLVVVITVCFFLAWMPFAVVALIGVFGDASLITPLVSVLPGILAKISTISNPLIYAIGHPQFRYLLLSACFNKTPSSRGKRKAGEGPIPRATTSRGMLSSVYFATVVKPTGTENGGLASNNLEVDLQLRATLDSISLV